MDFAELEIFREVALHGSVTRAAQALGRAQSNVTMRVQQLEEELGTNLFVRGNKRMTLSPEGERFLGYAQRLLAVAEEARQALREDTPSGLLRIGSMESTAASRLPQALLTFHRNNTNVKLEVTTGTTSRLISELRAHNLDCALIAHISEKSQRRKKWPADIPGIEGVHIVTEKLMLVSPIDFKLSGGSEELGAGPRAVAAFGQGCTYRRCADVWIASHGGEARWSVLDMPSYHAILACVVAGEAIGLIPESVLALYRDPFPVRAMPYMQVSTWLVRREEYRSAAYDAFLQSLRETIKDEA